MSPETGDDMHSRIQNCKKIALVGVGGAGISTIERVSQRTENDCTIIAVTRHLSCLKKTLIDKVIGLHAPKNDQKCIIDSVVAHIAEIRHLFEKVDHVILFVGLGGYTGSYTTPVIARLLHELGKSVWAVVYQPFNFEGTERFEHAAKGLSELMPHCDLVLTIQNQWLIENVEKNCSIHDALNFMNEIAAKSLGLFEGKLHSPTKIRKMLPFGKSAKLYRKSILINEKTSTADE